MEDDSLLDDPTIVVKEAPPQTIVTPGLFSKRLVDRLEQRGLRLSQLIMKLYNKQS